MIYSDVPCVAAGTFTTNIVKAAPVKWDRQVVYESEHAQAVICNSGIANACTGVQGMAYCEATAAKAAEVLGIQKDAVLVASTGVIGMQLKMDRIEAGIDMLAPALDGSIDAGHLAAKAIMTTDTVPKEVAVTFEIGGKKVTMGGMCKGSGMIHPNMCTMLAFITTDAKISKKALQAAMSSDVEDTYNMISVDGDTSTNDMIVVLSNGEAKNKIIDKENDNYKIFCNNCKPIY
jgi:glutamate N-acetyltransferase/amino-acid N-acetyltransferase